MKKTGGPAFPDRNAAVMFDEASGGQVTQGNVGMSLRDYFAAKAMQSILPADTDNGRFRDRGAAKRTASLAYDVADAMLEEREKPEPEKP